MMKITKWKLMTILEIDEEGITTIKHLDPIRIDEKAYDEDDEDTDEAE